jgi:hypothetical protein
MSGLRGRLKRLERDTEGEKMVIECPTCGEAFVLYGDPAADYLVHLWRQGHEGETHGAPTERVHPDPALVKLAEHEHDPSLMVDRADGSPWLGRKIFRGMRRSLIEDVEDLSEP